MGLIQNWQATKLAKFLAARKYNRRMRMAVKLLNLCAPYYIKMIGRAKTGTVYQVKDLNFNMKYNKFVPKLRKLSRGKCTNKKY